MSRRQLLTALAFFLIAMLVSCGPPAPGPWISSIQHSPEIAEEGQSVFFTINYSNTDTQNSFTDAAIVVGYDEYLSFISATPNLPSEDANQRQLTWTLGTLDPNQNGTITLEFQVGKNFPREIYELGINAQISGVNPNGGQFSRTNTAKTLILNHPTPIPSPTSPPPATAAPEASQTLVKVAYLKNVDVRLIGDGQGDSPGLAIELVDKMFTNNEKNFFSETDQEKIWQLLKRVAAGEYDLAVGFPSSVIKQVGSGLLETDPYFCTETIAGTDSNLMAEVNENLSVLRQDGSLDSLVTKYFKPQRSAEASAMETWAKELNELKDKTPHPFNPNGLSQFCTAANYGRDILFKNKKLSSPLALDVLRNLESSPEPDNQSTYLVTAPFKLDQESDVMKDVMKGESGPLGVLLRSANPYDISPTPQGRAGSAGLLMPAIMLPSEANVFLIEWNATNQQITLTPADGSGSPTSFILEPISPPTNEVTITLFEGSIVICAWWDGYGGCVTI